MPLSESEQHSLNEMERALLEEDPRFAERTSAERVLQLRRRWVVIPGVVFAVGMVALVAGLVTTSASVGAGVAISLVGVLFMATAVIVGVKAIRHR